jgi:hypothetical protein
MMSMAEFIKRYGADAISRSSVGRTKARRAYAHMRAEDEAKFKKERGNTDADQLYGQLGRYLGLIPRPEDVPLDYGIVHNQVGPPTRVIGAGGFRIWVQRLDDGDPPIEPCPCGWAPELGRHFRIARP